MKISYFSENYDVIHSSGVWTKNNNGKIYIGKNKNKVCRFCKKSENDTTFNNVSHAIPESLGNKQIILLEECDECNKKFAEGIEDSLDKYTKPIRTISQIKGKKKVPSIKSRDKKSRIDAKNELLEIRSINESDFYELDLERNQLKLKIDREPYIPSDVYKAFMKIAISIIDDESELEAFKYTIRWLLSDDRSKHMLNPLKIWRTFIPGYRIFREVSALLLRKKTDREVPYAILILGLSNYIYQMIVPSHIGAKSGEPIDLLMPFFPTIFDENWQFGDTVCNLIDFTGNERIYDDVPIIMNFEKIELKT
jgi:hypothetical protein